MSDFWSGVAGALIGAVVGGFFTAIVARYQIRETQRMAAEQLGRTYEQQRSLMLSQLTQNAIIELVGLFEKIRTDVDDLVHGHQWNRVRCKPAELDRFATNSLALLLAVEGKYRPVLPEGVVGTLDSLVDDLAFQWHDLQPDTGAGSDADCGYCKWLSSWGDRLFEASRLVAKAVREPVRQFPDTPSHPRST